MFREIIVCLSAISFIYVVKCAPGDPINDLIKDLKPQVEKASKNVADLVAYGGAKVKDALDSSDKHISLLQNKLDDSILKLLRFVEKAEAEAESAGTDISACIAEEKPNEKKLTGASMDKCKHYRELDDLEEEVTKFANLKTYVNNTLTVCVTLFTPDYDNIKDCIVDAVNLTNGKSNALRNKIDTTVGSLNEDTLNCSAEISKNMMHLARDTFDNFYSCISS